MHKTMHFCTLFDANYLDKGIVLYYSLRTVCEDFMLYFFALDQITYDILMDLNLEKTKVIELKAFENPELIKVKEKRSKGEYCWTCTPIIVKYVLECYMVDCCTYIDADLYFYQSPQVLLKEFCDSGKAVGLTPHRFPDTYHGKVCEKRSGKYCVQFNSFLNNKDGKDLLEKWRIQCLEECSWEGGGDQLYISDWGIKYDCVYEYQNLGAGVAPWNLANYRLKDVDNIWYVFGQRRRYQLVFYHFQNIQYSDDGRINVNVIAVPDGGLISKQTVRKIYYPYLKKIELIRDKLENKYHIKYYRDGCGREFRMIKFNLFRFLKSFFHKIKKESIWSALDLVIRVFRKKDDIIFLAKVRKYGK